MRPGERLGPYEVVAPLGSGGMGHVYRARDTRLGRDVAIKLLLPELFDDPQLRARFEREAQTLAALNHRHIAAIHDIVECGRAGPARIGRDAARVDQGIPLNDDDGPSEARAGTSRASRPCTITRSSRPCASARRADPW